MKKEYLLLLVLLISFPGLSQGTVISISEDLMLIPLSNNAVIHVSYKNTEENGRVAANGMIFINNQEAFLFDTPWTEEQTRELTNYLYDSMGLTILGFIPNHWHEDCMAGIDVLHKRSVSTYAHQMTNELAAAHQLSLAQNSFSDSLELRLGNQSVFCYYLGAAHSTDNIVVWIPSEKILFPACMVKSMNARNLGNTADGDLEAYPGTIKILLEKFPDAEIVIPGHGNYGGKELIEHTLSLCLQ